VGGARLVNEERDTAREIAPDAGAHRRNSKPQTASVVESEAERAATPSSIAEEDETLYAQ
jgi:hypothetical protein